MFMPFPKRNKSKQPSDFDQLLIEMQGLRKEIKQLFQINKQLPIPIGLKRVLHDTFRCCICQSTMVSPVIFGRCCKSMIGCQLCTDQWFRGEEGLMQACPKCRAERAYTETCAFKGIDDFLLAIRPLVQLTSSTENEEATEIWGNAITAAPVGLHIISVLYSWKVLIYSNLLTKTCSFIHYCFSNNAHHSIM